VVFDTNLVPENFGSVQRMDAAAFDTASAGVAVIGANESGRVELAEIPEYNIAERFNSTGPYVTNMDINVATAGITTSYQFNTWTPNFGKLTKYNADRVSRIFKAPLEALRRFREKNPKRGFKPIPFQKTDFDKIAARLQANRTSGGFALFGLFGNPHQEADIVNFSDAFALALPKKEQSFGCSVDQQWSAAGTRAQKTANDSGVFFQLPTDIAEEEDGRFVAGVCPSSRDLDPYFSEAVFDEGVMIQKVDAVGVMNSSQDGEMHDLQPREANKTSIINQVRGLGLRGPLIVSGWGFDVANNPVPSLDNDITRFNSNHCVDRNYWKTGPVNLMWDEERKTWNGGLEIVCGILNSSITSPSSPLSPTTFDVRLLRKTSEGKGSGALEESGEIVTCYNRDPSLSQASGDNVFCMIIRINYEWTPLWIGCP
jgi:hypothetical protein